MLNLLEMTFVERHQGENGFVLVEALAAFMILVVGLVAIYEGLGGALERKSRSAAMTEATRMARSELERFSLIGPETKITYGQAGPYSWRRTVGNSATHSGPEIEGYWVSVSVFDQSQRELLSLTTFKLSRKAPP